MVHPLKVTLEQLYKGSQRTLRLTRKVIDKQRGVETCSQCGGRGYKIQTIRMGPMIQQVQKVCDACGGNGQSFRQIKVQETLEVHVPKGAPDQHKLHFSEKADEIPDGEAGDVVFVLQEQPHPMFKRKGDDLFIDRTISLSEALCGFAMELTHLDGRTLIIKTNPGEVIKPVAYDPFAEDERSNWTLYDDCDVPSLENAAVAETEDLKVCKKACESGQLKGKGIGCFVQKGGRTVFKQCSYDEALKAKTTAKGSKLYIISDPSADAEKRMMKAVEGEGLPRLRSPFEFGNLFVTIQIEFPPSIPAAAAGELLNLLPPPMHVPKAKEDDDDVDVCQLKDIDPQKSYMDRSQVDPCDEDDDEGGGPGGQRVQCAQQ
jgi:DnaJ family protein A protein 2